MILLDLIGKINDPFNLGEPLSGGPARATTLLSSVIKLAIIGGGVFAFINFVVAGIGFISSAGNPERVSQSWARIYTSMIGLAVMVISFAFAALLGILLFGNPTAILKPTISGPS